MSRSGPSDRELRVTELLPGDACGELLVLEAPLSFWGGLDPCSGIIIDIHHPQHGACVKGRMLVVAGTKGSTAGPGALLETVFAGNGPAGILLTQPDLVVIIAMTALESMGAAAIPLFAIDAADASLLATGARCWTSGRRVWLTANA